jgi:uncharacterized membrane protein (UPF0127 family)
MKCRARHLNKKVIGILAILVIAAVSISYFVFQPHNGVRIIIDGVIVSVDLATTPAQQQRGLSGRSSMAQDHGMLFIFQTEDYWSFWMYEMNFPLDMIWFNANRQAVFFEQNLPPCNPTACPVFTPTAKALYVLEVNAGFIAEHRISLGDTFTFVSSALPVSEGLDI